MSYDTYAGILSDVLDRAGEGDVASADSIYSLAGRQIVRGYHELCNAHPFLFLRANPPGVIRTLAPVPGVVQVTQDSAAITFGAAIAASMVGRKLQLTGSAEWYRILTHVAGTAAATLDCAYTDASQAAAACTIFQDEYDLAADLRHLVQMTVAGTGQLITGTSETALREAYPVPTAGWPPQHYARIGEQRIRFSAYPTEAKRIEYAYTIIPADPDGVGAALCLPRNWRYVLADAGLYWTYLAKDDDRATATVQLLSGGLERMIEDDLRKRFELGHDFRSRS